MSNFELLIKILMCSTKISRDPWIHKKKLCDICGFTTTEKETLDKHIIQAQ